MDAIIFIDFLSILCWAMYLLKRHMPYNALRVSDLIGARWSETFLWLVWACLLIGSVVAATLLRDLPFPVSELMPTGMAALAFLMILVKAIVATSREGE